MKVQLTQADFDQNRVTKIARVLSKLLRADLGISHLMILEILASCFGYSSYYEAKLCAKEFRDQKDFDAGFPRYFDSYYPPSTEVVREQFEQCLSAYVADSFLTDNLFERIPLSSLDFFREETSKQQLGDEFIKEVMKLYFNDFRQIFMESFNSDGYDWLPCPRRAIFKLLSGLGEKESTDLLLKTTVSEFLSQEISTYTDNEEEIVGTYSDISFSADHESLTKIAVHEAVGQRGKLSSKDFNVVSNILRNEFVSAYGSLPLLSLFKVRRDSSNFYGEYGQVGWGFKWSNISSPLLNNKSAMKICKIVSSDGFNKGSIEGIYWRYETFSQDGNLECYVSGGLYYSKDDLESGIHSLGIFPSDDNATSSREQMAITRLTCGDLSCFDQSNEAAESKAHIINTLRSINITTVTSLEKRKGLEVGIGASSLLTALRILESKYGDQLVHVYSAPMQYIDWQPEDDLPLLTKNKKRDVSKLEEYLSEKLHGKLKMRFIRPRV